MTYSVWGRLGVPETLAAGDSLPPAILRIDPGMTMLYTFEAPNWDAAMAEFVEAAAGAASAEEAVAA